MLQRWNLKRWAAACAAGLVATVSVAAGGGAALAPSTERGALLDRLYAGPSGDVMVMAHRGLWRQAPENSLLAVRLAIEAGVEIVEIDVRRTADDQLVVIHDKTLERTTTGTGRVDATTLAEVRALRLLNGYGLATRERVPTLAEVMELCRGRALVYIDKAEGMIPRVAAELEASGDLAHALFYGTRPLAEVRAEVGDVFDRLHYLPKVDLSTADAEGYIAAYAVCSNVPAFIVSFDRETPRVAELFAVVRGHGRRVMVSPLWDDLVAGRTDDRALDDPAASWGWLRGLGASVFCTDRPERLAAYLRSGDATGASGGERAESGPVTETGTGGRGSPREGPER